MFDTSEAREARLNAVKPEFPKGPWDYKIAIVKNSLLAQSVELQKARLDLERKKIEVTRRQLAVINRILLRVLRTLKGK